MKRAFQREITKTIITPKQDYKSVYNWHCFPKQILTGGDGGKTIVHTRTDCDEGEEQRALVERTQQFSVKAHERAQNTEAQSYSQ